MRLLSAACVIALLPASAPAQTTPPAPMTLDMLLDLGAERSESIAIARAAIRRAEGEEMRARSGLFPQVTASLSYDRALASEFEGLFNDVAIGEPAEPGPDAPDGGGLADLPFGRENTWRLSFNFSQNLFDGGRIRAQRALASAGRDSATLGLTMARAQLLFDVTQAYYDAALSDRLVAIAEATIEQAGATLQQAEAAFSAGAAPEFDVLRARVSRDTQNPNLIRQRVNREIALLRLKQLLDLAPSDDLRVADVLADDLLPPPPVFAARVTAVESVLGRGAVEEAFAIAPPAINRAAAQDAATAVTVREAALDAVRAQRMPAVSLTSNYGRIAYPSNPVAPSFDRTNWTVGANLQVPILTGGRQRADEAVAQAELDQTRDRLRQVEELAALDTRSAWAELIAARATWEATAGTVQQANRAYELADIRYQAGVSTQLELSDSRLLLQQAEANRAQAARDLQVARARVALLPDLPLGPGGTVAPGGGQPLPAVPQQPAPQGGGGQIRTAAAQGGAQQFGGQP